MSSQSPTDDIRTDLIRWLSQPASYPHQPQHIDHLETHISHIFLAGEFVYKLKKEVRFDFLDFSTLAARQRACETEVLLNRRLAPDTYLGVIAVTHDKDGCFRWQGTGPEVEWLVQMRRLPTDVSLEQLICRDELQTCHVQQLLKVLLPFYQSQLPAPISAAEYRRRFVRHVKDNWRELRDSSSELPRDWIDRVHGFQLQTLRLQPELFDERIEQGRVVDGHGDLRPEHICLVEPPLIFDCIEFNAEFRQNDVVDELAFLAAECDYLQAGWFGEQLLQGYGEQSGDRFPDKLLAFYKTYRACVRAKVADLRTLQMEADQQQQAHLETLQHLQAANDYSTTWIQPILLAVGGLSGTGKSTLGRIVADALGMRSLRSDEIRRVLFTDPDAREVYVYSAAARDRVYRELLQRAADLLAAGVSVVLDATFADANQLTAASQLAERSNCSFVAVECTCRSAVALQRIATRQRKGGDPSEADQQVYLAQQARWQTWPTSIPQIRVDTEEPIEAQLEQVVAELRKQIACIDPANFNIDT